MPKLNRGWLQEVILSFLVENDGWFGVPFLADEIIFKNSGGASQSQLCSVQRCIRNLRDKGLVETRPVYCFNGEYYHEPRHGWEGEVGSFNEVKVIKKRPGTEGGQ